MSSHPIAILLGGLVSLLIGADEPRTIIKRAPDRPEVEAPKLLLDQPAADYKERRKALMARVREAESLGNVLNVEAAGGDGAQTRRPAGAVIVMVGESEEPEDGKYRQSNNFAYLTGVAIPHAAMILRPEDGTETLYLPPRDLRMENWTGPKLGPGKEAIEATGFDHVESTAAFLGDLFTAIGDPGVRGGARSASVYLLSLTPRPSEGGPSAGLARLIKDGAARSRLKDLAPLLAERRKVKSAAEIGLLRKAIAITTDAHEASARLIAPGVPEYRVEGAILGAFIGGGGMRAGFASIVGSGLNSTVLHYNANRRTMQDGELVVVDIGGEYAYYTADITRTYPVGGKFTPRQREIYQLVLDCQSAAAADFKVGVTTLGSQNRFARNFFRESKLRAKDKDGVERSMDAFFTHGLGHYLGMDVHDVGDSSKPLGPGEVFTIEPGLYIPTEGFGVRIEDDYLVTKDGLDKLSGGIPSAPDEVERRMAAARPRP